MKLYEYRLLTLNISKDGEIVFNGKSEELPEEYKNIDSRKVTIQNNTANIEID